MENSYQNEGSTSQEAEGRGPAEGDEPTATLATEGESQEPPAPQPDDLLPGPELHLSLTEPETPPPLRLNSGDDMEDEDSPQEQEEDEDEDDLVILDPDHPLVGRLQAALTNMFSNQLERAKLELVEKTGIEKADASHSQEVGIEMFRIQEQLARVQKRLEDLHQTKAEAETKRQQAQDHLEDVKSRYSSISSQNSQAQAEVAKLHVLLDRFLQHLLITQRHSEDLHSKIKTVNNFKSKAAAQKTQAEERKLKQDMYVERLTKEMERLTEQISMYEAQTSAQAEETLAAKEALSEAEMRMESHLIGHKQLVHQWNSSLMARQRRVEASLTTQDVRAVEHQLMLLDREIESYKRSFLGEQEKNETLTLQLSWSEMDCGASEKLIAQKRARQEALQADYSACVRIVHETERTLLTLTKESDTYQTELNGQRRQREKESALRLELEDKIMTYMQTKLTHHKAAQYSQQLRAKTTSLKNKKMHQVQLLENEALSAILEKQHTEQQVGQLEHTQRGLDDEVAKLNILLNSNQARLTSSVQTVEQKQSKISIYNDKIAQIAASTGHEDLNPQQIRLQQIEAEMEELDARASRDQQLWMGQQGVLVGLTREREAIGREIRMLHTEIVGLQQKKLRLESQLELEEREEADMESSSKMLWRDLEKLNTLLSKNQQLSQALEQDNALTETDFLHRIKEAERKSVGMEMKLSETQEEKERLLSCLVEAERQVMLWEKKTQILKETRSVVDSEIHDGDIKKMKAEIHHMELRVSHLGRQQERLMRESESVVSKRESLVLRQEALSLSSHRRKTAGELKRSNDCLQRRIQSTGKEGVECERRLRELRGGQLALGRRLQEEREELTQLLACSSSLDAQLTGLQDAKETKRALVLTLQARGRRLQAVSEGSYAASSQRTAGALQSHAQRTQAAAAILQQVWEELPRHRGALRRAAAALAAHTQAGAVC